MGYSCRLVGEGLEPGCCLTSSNGREGRACQYTLRWLDGIPYRLVYSYGHKAPEFYLSIYQSGCNWNCLKCHSWRFTKNASGRWMSPADIGEITLQYYESNIECMVWEPRDHATSWHAHELCRGCGSCIILGRRSKYCPRRLGLDKIVLLDDGSWGPARNIISFTGGDLACQPEFYVRAAEEVKSLGKNLWILFETNGYGLTSKNLDSFKDSGIDSFWLDIKAYDEKTHRRLTGASNKSILDLPPKILERDFVLEVSTVYIPGWVECDQISKIAGLLSQVDRDIPYSIVAFIPEYKLTENPTPSLEEMVEALHRCRDAGLRKVRLGNIGVFARKESDYEMLTELGAI
ncbi:MAG: radical SAM protein [Candidatus Bathyarchaeia archaeon]